MTLKRRLTAPRLDVRGSTVGDQRNTAVPLRQAEMEKTVTRPVASLAPMTSPLETGCPCSTAVAQWQYIVTNPDRDR